ncbi:unnamed protein product [Rotaria sp. Silwood1]|nr:unnamed protein product [Rotaria sp. Silwood1]CAF3548898.1 unnamed protein product [Rotaria sp. Silwood1]CAF3576682.1 unnamed protein product [Rotaria sp. Silwood1]CAF4850398.1 unnamed protein product [Rotaria sp. Silwood1]CAF5086823.1 unnamed protein product [Rotaria sp. Silwood1]
MGKGAECTAIIVGATTTGATTGAGVGAVGGTCVMPGVGTVAASTGGAIVGATMGFIAGMFGAIVHAVKD